MKRSLGMMALGLGLALVGTTASWAQVTGGAGGSGGPGNGTSAEPPSGMNSSQGGGMNNNSGTGMGGGAAQSTPKKDTSPASTDAGAKQEK